VLPMVTGSISLAVRSLQDFEFGSCRSNRDSVHVAPKKAAAFLDTRRRPYSWSEVIHRAGDESIFSAFERERPRIVNNFAASASSGYEFSSSSVKMNSSRLSNLAIVLDSATNTQD